MPDFTLLAGHRLHQKILKSVAALTHPHTFPFPFPRTEGGIRERALPAANVDKRHYFRRGEREGRGVRNHLLFSETY